MKVGNFLGASLITRRRVRRGEKGERRFALRAEPGCGMLEGMQSETKVHTCGNGLTVLVQTDHSHPVVSVQFWVRTGAMFEGERLGSGLSHLIEHMVFKGTRKYGCRELAEAVQGKGGHWNAYTTESRTVFYIDGPSESWRDFVDFLSELVFFPSFPEEEFEREKEVIRREMAMYLDDPEDAAWRALMETLYKRSPRRLPVLGERNRFDRLSLDDLKNFHAGRYAPGNVFVVAAGDVEPDALFAQIEKTLGNLPPKDTSSPAPAREPRQWGPRIFRTEFAQPVSTLMLAWRIPEAEHPDAAPLAALAHILGAGRSAWLYEQFHDSAGMVHDVSATVLPARGEEGALVINAEVDREKRDAFRSALVAYVSELAGKDWAPALARTKRQMKAARLRRLSTVKGRAYELGTAWFLSGNPEAAQEWRSALERVSPQDMDRAASLYLRGDRLTEVSVDPLGSNSPVGGAAPSADAHPAFREIELENGLRVVFRPDRRIPAAYACIAFEAGAPTETEDTAGINALMAECLLKGTEKRDSSELASVLENLGGAIHSSAGNNTICINVQCLSEDLGTALDVLADVCLRPTFPEEHVRRERDAMTADVLDSLEDPVALAFRELKLLCYGRVSYGNPTDGTPESLSRLTGDALIRQHRRILCGANGALCLTGDFDCCRAEELVRLVFSPMPAGSRACGVPTPPQRAGELTLCRDKEQAVLALALPGVSVLSPEYPTMLLLNEWCRDMAGPFFTEIREKRGMAYYASSTALFGIDAGNFCLYLGTSPGQEDAARAALEETIAALHAHGMPPDALKRVRAAALSAHLMHTQSQARLCSTIAVDTVLGLPSDRVNTAAALIREVRAENMQALIGRVFSPCATRSWVTVRGN